MVWIKNYVEFCLFASLSTPSLAAYTLTDNYTPDQFYQQWTFFTDPDPTHGNVTYLNQQAAQSAKLVNTNNGQIYMSVDQAPTVPGSRNSVRVQSNKSYNHGLFVLDLAHMPASKYSSCSLWPSWWLVSSSQKWPMGGEIDVVEGVNDQAWNAATLHTGPGCSTINHTLQNSYLTTLNCDIHAPSQKLNEGCSAADRRANSYGAAFNANGGGIYAVEWVTSGISIWFFPKGTAPADVLSTSPKPTTWGQPTTQFAGGCDFDTSFKDLQMVFDITLCGDWAGDAGVWPTSSCASRASTCAAYVMNPGHPDAFTDAYWSVNGIKVYSDSGSAAAPVTSAAAPSTHAQQATNTSAAPMMVTSTVTAPAVAITPGSMPAKRAIALDGTESIPERRQFKRVPRYMRFPPDF